MFKMNSSTTTFVPEQFKRFAVTFFFNSVCAGDPVLRLCPAGHYCDGIPGSDFPSGAGPRPCPPYTYRASPGAGSKGDCLPCPPGSHCNSTGVKHGNSLASILVRSFTRLHALPARVLAIKWDGSIVVPYH